MTTRLEGSLKRELNIKGELYTLTLTSEGFHLAPKGRRKGYDLQWDALVSGEEAMAVALNASVHGARSEPASEEGPNES